MLDVNKVILICVSTSQRACEVGLDVVHTFGPRVPTLCQFPLCAVLLMALNVIEYQLDVTTWNLWLAFYGIWLLGLGKLRLISYMFCRLRTRDMFWCERLKSIFNIKKICLKIKSTFSAKKIIKSAFKGKKIIKTYFLQKLYFLNFCQKAFFDLKPLFLKHNPKYAFRLGSSILKA